jgi:formylglycine-generating enzyme
MLPRRFALPLSVTLASAIAFVALPAAAKTAETAHCPAEMAHIGGSCVDKWEASLVKVEANGAETPFSPYTSPKDEVVKAVSRPDVVPQGHISMVQAQNACQQAGKRLCKSDEWKTACKGPSMTKYPYGNEHVANACVDTNRTAPLGKLYSGAAMFSGTAMNDPRLNQMENTVEKTGAAAACTNDYGVHDMVGNVHEWVDDGAFHGGYYLDTKINREGCDYATTAHNSTYYDYSTGFRCCADADSIPVVEEAPAPAPVETKVVPAVVMDDKLLARFAQVVEGLRGEAGGKSSFGGLISIAPALPDLPGNSPRVSGKRRPRI